MLQACRCPTVTNWPPRATLWTASLPTYRLMTLLFARCFLALSLSLVSAHTARSIALITSDTLPAGYFCLCPASRALHVPKSGRRHVAARLLHHGSWRGDAPQPRPIQTNYHWTVVSRSAVFVSVSPSSEVSVARPAQPCRPGGLSEGDLCSLATGSMGGSKRQDTALAVKLKPHKIFLLGIKCLEKTAAVPKKRRKHYFLSVRKTAFIRKHLQKDRAVLSFGPWGRASPGTHTHTHAPARPL